MTYEIVRAQFVPGVGAGKDHIAELGCREGVAVEVFLGADERAVVLASINRRSTSEREQGQDRNDEGSREDHGERFELEWIPQVRDCTGGVVGRPRAAVGLLKDFEHRSHLPPVCISSSGKSGAMTRTGGTQGSNPRNFG